MEKQSTGLNLNQKLSNQQIAKRAFQRLSGIALCAVALTLAACVEGRQVIPDASVNLAPLGPEGDFDEDGITPRQGDCDDTQSLVNPDAVEIQGNNIDDDCNSQIDETTPPCAISTPASPDATSFVQALDLCNAKIVLQATLDSDDARARKIVSQFGQLVPKAGATMAVLSTGIAADKNDPNYARPQIGTAFFSLTARPNPGRKLPGVSGCGQAPPEFVYDQTELKVRLKVPANARNFSFDFYFMSAEYPEYVCTKYNDQFLVSVESPRGKTDTVAYDANKNPMTVNNGFFTVCENYVTPRTQNCKTPITELSGTGYEDPPQYIVATVPPANIGGGTGWLSTTVPVVPGEEITVRFLIYDEGNDSVDSTVLLDNFHWGGQLIDEPITIQ